MFLDELTEEYFTVAVLVKVGSVKEVATDLEVFQEDFFILFVRTTNALFQISVTPLIVNKNVPSLKIFHRNQSVQCPMRLERLSIHWIPKVCKFVLELYDLPFCFFVVIVVFQVFQTLLLDRGQSMKIVHALGGR